MFKFTKDRILARAKRIITSPQWLVNNIKFAYAQRNKKNQPKIFYTITPPPKLTNVGDHAQAIAIRFWLEKHYSQLPIIEVDKTQSRYLMPALKWLIDSEDLIFLHSGGNLGDRGMWSEKICIINHKLTLAMYWFKDIDIFSIMFA